MVEGKHVSPRVGQKGLDAGTRFPRVPPPPPGLRARIRRPPPASLREGDPAPAGPHETKSAAAAAPQRWPAVRRERVAAQARARPTAPRDSRGAHRLHGGGHVVVALRLLRQSRPLQQLLSVPHVARDSASPRAPEPPACSLARSPACLPACPLPGRRRGRRRARALARRLAGRLQAAPPLAPSRWLAARAVARAAEPPRENRGRRGRAGGEGGRDHACAVGAARQEAREGGGAAQP